MVFQHAKIAVLEKSYVYSTNEKGNDLVLFYRKQNSILIWTTRSWKIIPVPAAISI